MFVSTALRSFSKSITHSILKNIKTHTETGTPGPAFPTRADEERNTIQLPSPVHAVRASLALLLVAFLGGGLGGLPPRAVLRVPFDRLLQTGLEVGVLRCPTQFGAQLGRIDRVTAIMARTVLDPVERVLVLSHHLENHAQNGDVVLFTVGADQVRIADAALRQDRPHARAVVLGMNPVAHVLALAVQLRTLPVQDVRDLARDELLHMLVRTVVIRAVRDRRPDAVRASPRAHQHVGRGLRARVRAGRMVRGMLREPGRIVQGEVAVHLVRAHVVVADPVLPDRLQKAERALDVRFQERLRVRDRIVVMGLGRVVHDCVVARHDPVEQLGVADVAVHELDTILRQTRDILDVARIGQGIQHGHMHVRMVVDHVMHEIRPDETTATGHNDVLGSKRLFNHISNISCLRVRVLLENVKIRLDIQLFVFYGKPAGRLCKYG